MRVLLIGLFLATPFTARATDLGTVGLIDTPSARMRADGAFTATISNQKSSGIYSLTYQAMPWLEATFRYNTYREYFEYYDRSYEVKVRLREESQYLPAIAVGIRDLVGTGINSSEYVVGSKSFGNLDVSLGLGWGRLAGKSRLTNPLTQVSSKFEKRDANTGRGGEVTGGLFFRGKTVGVFGGMQYRLPSYPIALVAEYNPDQYDWEVGEGGRRFDSGLSYGLEWQATKDIKIGISSQHGEEIGLSLSASLDTKMQTPKFPVTPFLSAKDLDQSDLPAGIDREKWYDTLLYDMESAGLFLIEADYDRGSSNVTLVISNRDFVSWADAVALALSLADAHLPSRFRSITFLLQENNMIVNSIETGRPSKMSAVSAEFFESQIDILPGRQIETPKNATNFVKPKITVDVSVQNRLQFFDPDDPLRYQFFALFSATVPLPGSVYLRAAYSQDLVNNFSTIKRESNSVLPHVRSDMKKYYQEGESGIEALFLEKKGTFKRYFHYRVFGGILEEMFSGVGGEVLFQPAASRVAFGASLNWAKQREYSKGFKHLDYSALTGFLSAYWATPFYNYDLGVHLGQYLAKDVGGTVELRRTFDNGWSVGLWSTLTDVPFDKFGEGSFDKGLFFKVPFNIFAGRNTRGVFESRLRPIQRDGGQRLEGFSGNIWYDLRGLRYDALTENKWRMKP